MCCPHIQAESSDIAWKAFSLKGPNTPFHKYALGQNFNSAQVSHSSVTLRGALGGVPVYDEYLCADHRWVRSAGSAGGVSCAATAGSSGRRRYSESEDELALAGPPAGSADSSASSSGDSYVAWTKSSLRSKQWQLLHGQSSHGPAKAPGCGPAASQILRDDGLADAADGDSCVALLAPCPAPTAGPAGPTNPRPPPDPQRQRGQRRHPRQRAEFDGLLQYLQDYRHGLRELLVNNNVVIIEPVRASQAKAERGDLDRRAHSAPAEDRRDENTCR